MTQRQLNRLLCLIQGILLGMLFCPAWTSGFRGGNFFSVMDTIEKYADLGFHTDAVTFLAMALVLPILTGLGQFFLKFRSNFGTGACLSALYTLGTACFYEASRRQLNDFGRVTGSFLLMILLSLVSVGLEVYGFLMPYSGKKP